MAQLNRGRFITIEGVEGVGKSTNIAAIARVLEAEGITFITTREPGGTPVAERIRELLLDHRETSIDAMTELLLMFAARTHHVSTLIKPALAAGQWVICDRFTDSSYAYQGGGRRIDLSIIAELDKLSLAGFEPDLTIVLDLPVAIGVARTGAPAQRDRFEREQQDFFERTRKIFLDRANGNDRCVVVDADGDMEAVAARVTAVVLSRVQRMLQP